jgi:hypothetical protein
MFLFLIILLPSVLVYNLIDSDDKAVIPVALTGVLSSVLFCALKAFFSFMYHISSAAFFPNYAYVLFGQTLVPVAVVYLLFFFVSKDEISFRIKSYFPLMCSFYSIYLPYHIIAGSSSAYSAFELFLKPVLYLMMLAVSALCVRFVFRSLEMRNIKAKINWILALCVTLLLPAAIETLWFMGFPVWIWFLLWSAYVFFAVCGCINAWKDDLSMKNIKIFLPDFKK